MASCSRMRRNYSYMNGIVEGTKQENGQGGGSYSHKMECGNGLSMTDDIGHENSGYTWEEWADRMQNNGTSAALLQRIRYHVRRAIKDDHSQDYDYGSGAWPLLPSPAEHQSTYNHHDSCPTFGGVPSARCYKEETTSNPDSMPVDGIDFQRMETWPVDNYTPSAAKIPSEGDFPSSITIPAPFSDKKFCATSMSECTKLVELLKNEEGTDKHGAVGFSAGLKMDVKTGTISTDTTNYYLKVQDMELASYEMAFRYADSGGNDGQPATDCDANNSSSSAPAVPHRSSPGVYHDRAGNGDGGTGMHRCPYCPKKFKRPEEAAAHQEQCFQQRPFDCTQCGRRFTQKNALTYHLQTHTNVRPYNCHYCSRTFKSKGQLDQHLRIHTDTRPYSCHRCGQKFKQKSHLDQHERLHTGSKPFPCSICNKAFRQASAVAFHELTHLDTSAPSDLVSSGSAGTSKITTRQKRRRERSGKTIKGTCL